MMQSEQGHCSHWINQQVIKVHVLQNVLVKNKQPRLAYLASYER